MCGELYLSDFIDLKLTCSYSETVKFTLQSVQQRHTNSVQSLITTYVHFETFLCVESYTFLTSLT